MGITLMLPCSTHLGCKTLAKEVLASLHALQHGQDYHDRESAPVLELVFRPGVLLPQQHQLANATLLGLQVCGPDRQRGRARHSEVPSAHDGRPAQGSGGQRVPRGAHSDTSLCRSVNLLAPACLHDLCKMDTDLLYMSEALPIGGPLSAVIGQAQPVPGGVGQFSF